MQFQRGGFPFSVESLISNSNSKPNQNGDKPPSSSPVQTSGYQTNFSVDRLLDKQERNEDVEKKDSNLPRGKEENVAETQNVDDNFSWLHSTRYDPPPSKYKLKSSSILLVENYVH